MATRWVTISIPLSTDGEVALAREIEEHNAFNRQRCAEDSACIPKIWSEDEMLTVMLVNAINDLRKKYAQMEDA